MAKIRSRDDFARAVKRGLAAHAGHSCSNPECRAPTSGPQRADGKTINIGVASHITGAAPGGARYDPSLTPEERAGINNGIWLCQTCAKLVDDDKRRYSVDTLEQWKILAEQEARRQIGKAKSKRQPRSTEQELKRDLKLRDQMRKHFLKPWEETTPEHSLRAARVVEHPYKKFRYSEVIIHRIGDDAYPEIDEGTGISSWFKVELFDFYHAGIKAVLGIDSGVIEHGWPHAGNKPWAITMYNADFDRDRFREIGIWKLALIPFRNIRHYDLHGDEYYNFPHLYCTFSIQGMPYEGFEYAVVGKDEYDWPLNPEFRLPEDAVRAQPLEAET